MGPEKKIIIKSEEIMENKLQEKTESSSSFDDDVSGHETDSAISFDEFVSDIQDDATSGRIGKRQLTAHWMTYIQPLRWRCKWVELQMRQLNRLELKYTRELENCNHNVLQKVEGGEQELCSREVSFSGGQRRDKVYKRKRRKRIEDTEDIATYMSKHNLFSYYDKKKVPAEEQGNIGVNFGDEFGPDEILLCLKTRAADENMEEVLGKILTLSAHVSKLKGRLDEVERDIPGELSYADPNSSRVPCNALTNSARDPASPLNNRSSETAVGSSHNASQLMSNCNMGDEHLLESATMSLGEFEDDDLIFDDTFFDGLDGFEDFDVTTAESPALAATPCVSEEPGTLPDQQATPSSAQITASGSKKSQRGHKPRRHPDI